MNPARKALAIVILILLVGVASLTLYKNLNATKLEILSLPDINGIQHNITFEDKPTILLFFTSWCPYCNEDAPKIVSLYEKYKDQVNLYGVNLINRDESEEVIKYIDKYNIKYPVLLDEGKFHKKYKSPGFPTLIFLNKSGKESKRIVGATNIGIIESEFMKAIRYY